MLRIPLGDLLTLWVLRIGNPLVVDSCIMGARLQHCRAVFRGGGGHSPL